MRLISCHIENFGKLSNADLDFENGLTRFCYENGWGKSTLATFIRVMFYGFNRESVKKNEEKERNQFAPWQSGAYGGWLLFEVNGKRYKLFRTFGSKAAEDTFRLEDAATGLETDEFANPIGVQIFGIDSESFARTVFITQSDCKTQATDSINAKLGNVEQLTDDLGSFDKVTGHIEDEMAKLKAARRSAKNGGGIIGRLTDEITQLDSDIRRTSGSEDNLERFKAIVSDLHARREQLLEKRRELEELQSQVSKYKDLIAKKEREDELQGEISRRKAVSEEAGRAFPGEVPVAVEITEMQGVAEQVVAMDAGLQPLSDGERESLAGGETVFRNGVPAAAELTEVRDLVSQYRSAMTRMETYRFSDQEESRFRTLQSKFGTERPDAAEIKGLRSRWAESREKKTGLPGLERDLRYREAEEQKLSDDVQRRAGEAQEKENRRKRFFLFGIIAIVIGILMAVGAFAFVKIPAEAVAEIRNNAVTLRLVLVIVGVLVSLGGAVIMLLNRRPVQDDSGALMKNSQKDEIERLNAEIAQTKESIDAAQAEAEAFCRKWKIDFDAALFRDILRELEDELRDYDELTGRKLRGEAAAKDGNAEELLCKIRGLLEVYTGDPASDSAKFDVLIDRIERQSGEYERCLKKKKKYDEDAEQLQLLKAKLDAYCRKYSADGIEEVYRTGYGAFLQALAGKLQHYNATVVELKKAEQNLEEFKAANPGDFSDVTAPDCSLTLEEISDRLKENTAETEEIKACIEENGRSVDEIEENISRREADRMTKIRYEEELAEHKKTYELLGKTLHFLDMAKQNLSLQYTEPLREGIRKYVSMIAGEEHAGDYDVNVNSEMSVMELGLPRKIDSLSRGWQDLSYIALRLALADAMYSGEKPFLILDDPFVNLDDSNMEGAEQLLANLASERQVLYFTCTEKR